MPPRLLFAALGAALALAPVTPAQAQPDLPKWCELVGLFCPVIDEDCVRNYEYLEGDVCSPVEDDTGTLQFVFDLL